MDHHPNQTHGEQTRIMKNLHHIHAHSYGRHKDVNKHTTHLGSARAFKRSRLCEAKRYTNGSGNNDQPEKPRSQAKFRKYWEVRAYIRSNTVTHPMR